MIRLTVREFRKLCGSRLVERLNTQIAFCTTSGNGDIASGIEDLHRAAEAGSEDVQKTIADTGFPVKSPLLTKESSTSAQLIRNKYLRNVLSNTKPKPTEESVEEDPSTIDRPELDPDTGFAEIGGFKTELTTGLLTEEPMRLHPTRLFIPGQVYEPEELHPLGMASADGRFSRRPRQPIRFHSEEDLKRKLNFKNLMLMNNYLSDGGLILPRRLTRLSKRVQKKLVKSVKLAQALALLPVLDRRPEFKRRARRVVD